MQFIRGIPIRKSDGIPRMFLQTIAANGILVHHCKVSKKNKKNKKLKKLEKSVDKRIEM